MKKLISIAVFLLILAPLNASADDSNVSIYMQNMDNDGGYGYHFEDDPLNAGGFGTNDQLIRVRPKAARVTLIRPRTSFIHEILKSVENI